MAGVINYLEGDVVAGVTPGTYAPSWEEQSVPIVTVEGVAMFETAFLYPTGISSAEAFGTALLTLYITPSGIASAEAVGTPSLTVSILPGGIASAEAFGTALLTLYILPSGIASAEAFGTASLAVSISPASIASAEAFGTPSITLYILPSGIASAEAFGTALLTLYILPSGIASAEALGTPSVANPRPVRPPTRETIVIPCEVKICASEPSDFTLYNLGTATPMVLLAGCQTRVCPPNNDLTIYNLGTATPMVLLAGCQTRVCPPNNDLTIYNLQDSLYFNGTAISVLADCPTGYYCPPGMFPRVFTYPPGTFVVVVPPYVGSGFPIVSSIVVCESPLNTVLPAGSSPAQIHAAADILIAEAAAQQARCDATTALVRWPRVITLTAISQYACVNVPFSAAIFASATPSGSPYTLSVAPQPGWMVTAQNESVLFLDGTPTAIGPVAFTVTATGTNSFGTQAYTLNIVGIATASPLAAGALAVPYSETLDASSIPGVLTWTVTSGALPNGLTLNSSTGKISGTPTVDAAFNFTIRASNGTVACSKAFALTVSSFNCLGNPSTVATAVWAQTGGVPPCQTFAIAAGIGTFLIDYDGFILCVDSYTLIETTICNPGLAYTITATIPWDVAGNVVLLNPHLITASFFINGILQGPASSDQRDLVTGPFTPFVITASLPTGASNLVEIQIAMLANPNLLISAFSNGNLTITPLTPP